MPLQGRFNPEQFSAARLARELYDLDAKFVRGEASFLSLSDEERQPIVDIAQSLLDRLQTQGIIE